MTLDELKEILTYHPASGCFVWNAAPRRGVAAGAVAGSKSVYGYIDIRIKKRLYKAHRLAWFYVHGRWPEHQIDHINGDKADNRIGNLRQASNAENGRNRGVQKNNTSGVKGVSWSKAAQKWQVKICVARKQKYIGIFDDIDVAKRAWVEAAKVEHGDFARLP